jgi:hypothetical protein
VPFKKKRSAQLKKLKRRRLTARTCNILYADGDNYVFMDTDTYDQLTLPGDEIRDQLNYLKENMNVKIIMHGNETLGIELPKTVDLVQLKKPNLAFVATPVAVVLNQQRWKPGWSCRCRFSSMLTMC